LTIINFESNFDDYIHEGGYNWNGRLCLRNEKYEIIVDLLPNAKKMIAKMEKFGGYSITHAGSAKLQKGNMSTKKSMIYWMHCITTLLF
jgi:hypothetical protein